MGNPLVSIACITYNHASFIRQCLDGFIMQQVDFEFEIVIHDDASTDGTRDIILEYCAKYPHLFRPILQEENKYKDGKGIYARFVFPECRGKYIAMCEGDDYWTDSLKLQKQVDYLRSNSDYVMCSHAYESLLQNENKILTSYGVKSFTYDLKFLIQGGWAYQPLTIVFDKNQLDSNYYLYRNTKDMSLFYALLKNGKGRYLEDTMAIYRVHNNGVWSGLNLEAQFITNFNNRIGIYEIEKTESAAMFILSLWDRPWGRKILIKNLGVFVRCLQVFSIHWGRMFALKLFVYKFLLIGNFSQKFSILLGEINRK